MGKNIEYIYIIYYIYQDGHYSQYFNEEKTKMANVMLEIFDVCFFGMSSDLPAFRVRVFADDFELLIGVNKY